MLLTMFASCVRIRTIMQFLVTYSAEIMQVKGARSACVVQFLYAYSLIWAHSGQYEKENIEKKDRTSG